MPYKDKHSPEARASMSRRNKKYYDKNKKKIMEKKKPWLREYYLKNKDKWKNHTHQNSSCRRIRMFGVDELQYQEMQKAQGGKCAICGVGQEELSYTLCVDHDHKTGKTRGLLCHNCNLVLGQAKDSIDILQKSITYLQNQ